MPASVFENYAGHRVLFRMGNRQVSAASAKGLRHLRGFAMEEHRWAAAGLAANLEIVPGDATPHPSPDRLHRGFLSGETCGKPFHGIGFRVAIADLGGSVDTRQEAIAEAFNGLGNARNF